MDAVTRIPPASTPLFESIASTIQSMAQRTGATQILVVFSDGESNPPGGVDSPEKAIRVAREAGVSVFPVMLPRPKGPSGDMSSWRTNLPPLVPHFEAAESIATYTALSKETGGAGFDALVAGDNVLPAILKWLAGRVRLDYVAGYYPVSSGAVRRRQVEVVLKRPGTVLGGKRIVVH
jgi:hypothetical protein